MKRIAFITSEQDPLLISDDRLAIEPVMQLGLSVEPFVWDNGVAGIGEFDAIIFRSCWNYHRKFEKFVSWILQVKDLNVPTFNSIPVSLWNLHKKYLLDLANAGVAIPRTELILKDSHSEDLRTKLVAVKSEQVIIKPAISLNGEDTYLCDAQDIARIGRLTESLLSERDVLIQEYIPEVQTFGEISLLFFNKKYSHSVRKTPAANEFRIHTEYGGSRMPFSPGQDLIDSAAKILDLVSESLLFARVDFIVSTRGPLLVELELVDPMLYLACDTAAAGRFAENIAESVSEGVAGVIGTSTR